MLSESRSNLAFGYLNFLLGSYQNRESRVIAGEEAVVTAASQETAMTGQFGG